MQAQAANIFTPYELRVVHFCSTESSCWMKGLQFLAKTISDSTPNKTGAMPNWN